MVALLPHPGPPLVHALASVISNLFWNATPRTRGSPTVGGSPAGLVAVCLRRAAWYRCLAKGALAGYPACGSREALHHPAAGDKRSARYRVISDLAQFRLPAIGVLGLTPPRPPCLARHPPALGAGAPHTRSVLSPRCRPRGTLHLAPSRLRPLLNSPAGWR